MLVRVEDAIQDTSVVLLDNILTASAIEVTYQWFDCADTSVIAGADQRSFSPTTAGGYLVQLQAGDCISLSGCHYAPGEIGTGISVYPNPAHDLLNITLNGTGASASFELLDAIGRVLNEGPLRSMNNVISMEDLPAGTYMLHVKAFEDGQELRWVRMVVK
nr:T9SS type A sorting domain-containing protein [Bacteroidota bacterium]